MAVIFNFVLPILAGIAILAMFFFIIRAFNARSKASQQAYNVGRQEAIKTSRVHLIRAVFALIVSIIFIVAIGLGPTLSLAVPLPTETPIVETPVPTLETTVIPTATQVASTAVPSPTSPLPTPSSTSVPTVTNTPAPPTATVNSGVGIWLRSNPGVDTDQLEWLLDGTVLILLEGEQSVGDLVWQEVQTEEGVIGWVASEFIVVNDQP